MQAVQAKLGALVVSVAFSKHRGSIYNKSA